MNQKRHTAATQQPLFGQVRSRLHQDLSDAAAARRQRAAAHRTTRTRVKGSTSCATGRAALSVLLLRYQAAALCRSLATTWRGASRSPMRKAAPGPWTGWANPPTLERRARAPVEEIYLVLAVEGRGTALSRYEDGLCSSQEAHNTERRQCYGPGVVRLREHAFT